MTSREARTRRRSEERRAAKLEEKSLRKSAEATVPRFNPELEDEFPRELQIEANAMMDRIYRKARLAPIVSSRRENLPPPPRENTGFVSQTDRQSSKRAEINRANSQHSTGPKSPDGKLASSRNSFKHGLASRQIIIPGEDPAAFEALLHDLLDEHQPANPTEELLINEMAQSYWLTQRALRFQNECFTENGVDEKRLSLFLRYQTTHDRSFHKALSTLLKLKREHQRALVTCGFVSQDRPNSPKVTQSARDNSLDRQFVRQNNLSQVHSGLDDVHTSLEKAA